MKVTAKGQVALGNKLLKHLGVAAGHGIVVDLLPLGRVEFRAARSPSTIDDFIGCLRQADTRSVSVEEINEIAADDWAGKN